jgi:hypothetical protein
MACTKWEELGLLYTSDELAPQVREQYVRHLEACEECRNELALYQSERDRLYASAILEEQTSTVLDQEIIRVCSGNPKAITSIGLFAALARKPVAVALLFLATGLVTGTYVAYHADNANRVAQQPAATDTTVAGMQDSVTPDQSQLVSETPSGDSLIADSVNDSSPFPRSRQNDTEGVVPVDLRE